MRKGGPDIRKLTVHLAAVAAMLFWGFSFILSKYVFLFYTPLTTIFFRLLISVLFLFAYLSVTGQFEKLKKKDLWLFAGSAVFNPFLYFIGENYGLQRVPASVTSIIIATIPVFTPFFAWYVFRERIRKINVIGLIISFLGLMLIIVNRQFQIEGSLSGVLFLFMAVFAAIVYTLFVKRLSFSYKPVTIIAWQNLIGLFLFAPFFIINDYQDVLHINPGVNGVLALLALGILCSSLAFVLYTISIKHIGVIKANLYTNLVPVIASVAAFFILKESFTLQKIIGMVIVILGVVLSEINFSGKSRKKTT
jgi:drug/metabolite transporter (DMT)-like permease